MTDFSTIYKILSALRDSMDYEQFDMRLISAERLGITEPRRSSLLRMLVAFRFSRQEKSAQRGLPKDNISVILA